MMTEWCANLQGYFSVLLIVSAIHFIYIFICYLFNGAISDSGFLEPK